MGSPRQSTCAPWATSAEVCSPCDDYAFDAALLDDALQAASDLLYELSGRRWPGSCRDRVRPCRRRCVTHRRSCGCRALSQVDLGVSPVTSIAEVLVDGAVLDPARYRVDDWRWLVRLPDADGTNPGWPACQRIDRADTGDRTFAVEFTYGTAPPTGGVFAAAALGCQIALACQPETVGSCVLPRGATIVTRQGISFAVPNPEEVVRRVPEVALFLDAYNPAGIRRRAVVTSPDVPRAVRRVGT